ncbi:MAG: CinA family protein [Candidatus Nanopelagicaceae bacterium]
MSTTKQQVEQIITYLNERGETISVAESLTAGGLANMLTSASGSSAVFVGGITAYRNEIKSTMLDVDPKIISEFTVVSEEVADAMAEGARKVFGTTWAISTTGAAGPDPLEGHAPGSVWISIRGPINQALQLNLEGGREQVRNGTISTAIGTFARILKFRTL